MWSRDRSPGDHFTVDQRRSMARRLLLHRNVMAAFRPATQCIEFDPLRRRCVRLAKTGQYRKAAIALAELAHREQDPATWVRLGAMLLRAGRVDAGIDALKQGQ